MSVLIKGLKMPKGCLSCPLASGYYIEDTEKYEWANVRCRVLNKKMQVKDVLNDCPLIELPDHGDLIDRGMALAEIEGFYPPKVRDESEAEEINRVGWECAINCIEAYLRTVKPVIPAERSEDERTCD